MKILNLDIDRTAFTLIWTSLHSREIELLRRVEEYGEDSDEGADALNMIVVLRIYRDELKEQAEKIFDKNAFIVSDEPIQL